MSLLPECPVCFGLMTRSKRSTLSSACRCGYPEEVRWDDFPKADERADLEPKELPNGRFQVAA